MGVGSGSSAGSCWRGCYHPPSIAEHDVMDKQLSKAGREELALALLLLKDFKCQGTMNLEVTVQIAKLAEHLGVLDELVELTPKIPPMKIVERWPDIG